jgi:membrane-bound serine protease (ClpP class)
MRSANFVPVFPKRSSPTAWLVAASLLLALISAFIGPAFALQRNSITVLEVRGVIDPIVARYVERSIRAANASDAMLVVIQMNTPGGLDTAMRDIIGAILNSDVPVAVFVTPAGARAASAGVFITMAAHVAAMSPGTNIGAASPVALGEGEMPATLQDTVTIAQERGRNADWAAKAVRESASLTAQQALESDVVDFLAQDLNDLLAQLQGHPVIIHGNEVRLDLETAAIEMYPMTWLEGIAHGLVDPNIAYVLLSIGTIALIAEMYNPGSIIPGVTGLICLILAFVAFGSLPVNWGGVALIVLAVIFFILDIKVSGFALTVAGIISFVFGSLLLFSPFRTPAAAMPRVVVSPWLVAGMTAAFVGFFGLALAASLRTRRQQALMGDHTLIGKTGVVVADLNPQGIVHVQSEMWTAITTGEPLKAGETVEVIGSDGLRLQVRRPLSRQE